MAHKEWEPDEFLDEFLDFDYKNPHGQKHSKGLPAQEVKQSKQDNKSYGLGDDLEEYKQLRHANNLNAGQQTAKAEESHGLRSSGALRDEIPAPLSSRKDMKGSLSSSSGHNSGKDTGSNAGTGSAAATGEKPVSQEDILPPISERSGRTVSDSKKTESAAAKQAESSEKKPSGLFSGFRSGSKRIKAGGIANEAIGAARKLVASEEDVPPEEIPPVISGTGSKAGAAAASSGKGYKGSKGFEKAPLRAEKTPSQEKDELAELFAELGESGPETLSSEENEALRQAQKSAYDRYRGNYLKTMRKQAGAARVGAFPRWLSRIYVLALAVFAVIMTVMNVLPFGLLIAFYVVLGLLSLIILIQLRKHSVKKWARVMASFAAVMLIALFGVGSAYSLGTLSFLDATSVKNENRVGSITREPFNVCFTGMDVYGDIDEPGRSDVNMIMTVNPKTAQILLTSIPRDYQIYMPDKDMAMDKLTHTGFYSVDTTMKAEENLLDTKINYYVKVNFTTVKAFIYAIGGIDVYSEYEFTPVKMPDWTVKKGWNHMTGKQAVAFARERKAFVDGDNQRIKNQQAVFEAVLKKATSSKTIALSYNKILSNLRDNFRMSFSSAEMRALIRLQIAKNPDWKIYKNTITGGDGSMPTYTTGNAYAYVMTQDETSINNAKSLINAVLEGTPLEKDDEDNVYVVGAEQNGEGESEGIDGESEGQ